MVAHRKIRPREFLDCSAGGPSSPNMRALGIEDLNSAACSIFEIVKAVWGRGRAKMLVKTEWLL